MAGKEKTIQKATQVALGKLIDLARASDPSALKTLSEYRLNSGKMHNFFEEYEKGLAQYKGSKLLNNDVLEFKYEPPVIDFNNLVNDYFIDYISKQTGRAVKRVPIKDTKHGDIYNEGFAFVDENGKELAHIAGNRKNKNVWVESSYVDPEFRHQGLGKQMYFDLNDHVFSLYGTTLHSSPMQRVGSTGAGMSPSNRLWKSLRDNGLSSVNGEGFNKYDVMVEPSRIVTAYRTLPITAENASNLTSEQWTAALDAAVAKALNITPKEVTSLTEEQWKAAIARGVNIDEVKRLRDLHFKVSAPEIKTVDETGNPLHLYHGTKNKFNAFDESLYGSTDGGMYGTGVYTTPYKGYAEEYGDIIMDLYANIKNPVDARNYSLDDLMLGKLEEGNNIFRWTDIGGKRDGVLGKNHYLNTKYPYEVVVHEPSNVKSADAVTFDDNGTRIPLGKRDNFNINDIRWVLVPTAAGLSIKAASDNTFDKPMYNPNSPIF